MSMTSWVIARVGALFLLTVLFVALIRSVESVDKQDQKCLQPLEAGLCKMNLERYYYDTTTNTCKTFRFGGCRGNDNKFGFLKTCEETCVRTTVATTPKLIKRK
ncbi:kappaPI-actitoxin-Avd3b [Teleopsis dalmanni]|uniref:kappaPI-actitoxin-Avd3b n=1 Tax=Teleopsis dalmanni TaxID=139649 RepID=UPI0018CD9E00|nr:kappaPI-actitoxin-Avd3b [Teleopsis dalmanni]